MVRFEVPADDNVNFSDRAPMGDSQEVTESVEVMQDFFGDDLASHSDTQEPIDVEDITEAAAQEGFEQYTSPEEPESEWSRLSIEGSDLNKFITLKLASEDGEEDVKIPLDKLMSFIESDEAAKQEKKSELFHEKRSEAEQDYLAACLSLQSLEDELISCKESIKEQKEIIKTLGQRLRRMRASGEAQLNLFDDGHANGIVVEGLQPIEEPKPLRPALPVSTVPSWDLTPTIDFLKTIEIKGLGAKKRELICEEFPTVGELEKARQKDRWHSCSLIGKMTAPRLEDELLNWLTVNRDDEAFAEARAAAEEREKAKQAAKKSHATDEELLLTRLEFLRGIGGELTCPPGLEEIYQSGVNARRNDEPAISCAWIAGDNQDAWLKGWLSHDTESENEEEE